MEYIIIAVSLSFSLGVALGLLLEARNSNKALREYERVIKDLI